MLKLLRFVDRLSPKERQVNGNIRINVRDIDQRLMNDERNAQFFPAFAAEGLAPVFHPVRLWSPTNSHISGRDFVAARWQSRNVSPRQIFAATTSRMVSDCAVMERSFLSLRRRLFFIRHMQGECEAASLSRFAGDAHFFAEMLHDFIGDGEAKPRALAVMRFIDFIETIKHVRQIRRGMPTPVSVTRMRTT